jgi:acetoin utilization protein AcuB
MLIREHMSANPITVGEETTVTEAADLMKKRQVRRFPVMRGERLVGMVTDRDLRSAAPSQVISFDAYERQLMPELYEMLAQIKVKEIMAKNVVTVSPDQTIAAAALLMLQHRLSGLPVVSNGDKLVGIITESDIFKALVDLSGATLGKILFGFRLEDRPGSIKEVADIIRAYEGRVTSILTSYSEADPEHRRVYIRIRDLSADKLQRLEDALKKTCEILHVTTDS